MKRAARFFPVLLLLSALAGYCVAPVSCLAMPAREVAFYLQVPASHLSVGQQFTPVLVSRTAMTDAPLVRVELLDAAGHRLWTESLPLPLPDQPARLSTLSLPHPGHYRLVATAESGPHRRQTETLTLDTAPEPSSAYGGVEAVNVLGLGSGIADYLQQHAFAVSQGLDRTNAPIIVVGDPRLVGFPLAATYRRLWAQVAAGANLLLLDPPMPGVAAYWPFHTRLISAEGCHDDLFPPALIHMHDGQIEPGTAEPVIRPAVAYDLSHESHIVAESLDAHILPRMAGDNGFAGCHAVFSFRYGQGLVTVSSLPLLQHFSDTWARVYLMNLIKTASRRVKGYPAGGLASMHAQQIRQLSAASSSPLRLAADWDPAPASIPAPDWPAPAVIDGSSASCFTSPSPDQKTGQMVWVGLGEPAALSSIQLNLGGTGDRPTAFVVEATVDGRHWTRLGDQSQVSADGTARYSAAGVWSAVHLRITANDPHHRWSLCEITPVPATPASSSASNATPATPSTPGQGQQ